MQSQGNLMKLPRRTFLHLAAGAAALSAVSRFAWAQAYPTRPVRMVLGFPAGGSTDLAARLLCAWLTERLGQSFVVLNRPGAGGTIGMQTAMRAAPDGHTLYNSYTAEAVIVPHMSKNKYSVIDDFEPDEPPQQAQS